MNYQTIEQLVEPTELSAQVLNDLTAKYARKGPPVLWHIGQCPFLERFNLIDINEYGKRKRDILSA